MGVLDRFQRNEAPSEPLPHDEEAFLEWVDFNELNSILSELQRRSGVPEDKVRIVARDTVKMLYYDPDYRPKSHGSGGGEGIKVQWYGNTKEQRHRRINKAFEDDGPHILFTLSTLIHESLHDTARLSVPRGRLGTLVDEHKRIDLGLATWEQTDESAAIPDEPMSYDDKVIRKTRVPLDEAMTEKMAGDVLMEYVRRKGLTNIAPKKTIEMLGTAAYQEERYVLEDTLDLLAGAFETDRTDIYRSLVRLYFSDEHSVDEVRQLVDGARGNSEFTRRLDDEWSAGFKWKERSRKIVPKRPFGRRINKQAVERLRNSTNLSKIENLLGL